MFFKIKKKYNKNKILSELINSYSLVIDPEKIFAITQARLIEFFPITSLIFFPEFDSNFSNLDKTINRNSNLVNWLLVNNHFMDLKEKYSEYINDIDEVTKYYKPDFIFPLISHNKLLSIVFINCSENLCNDNLEFLENIFQLAALSYESSLRIKTEREHFQSENQKEKLSVVGRMASYLAHEIRNPLTSIRSSIQFIESTIDDKNLKDIASGLIEEVDRVNALTHFISDFTKQRKMNITIIKIKDVIDNVLAIHQTQLTEKSIIFSNLSHEFGEIIIKADEEALKQVFHNFMLNSIDSLKNSSTNQISVSIRKSEKQFIFEWADSGCGISGDNLKNIFEPFFTTKSYGSGLGLAISKKLLDEQFLDLNVTSKVGSGTKFYFIIKVESLGRFW